MTLRAALESIGRVGLAFTRFTFLLCAANDWAPHRAQAEHFAVMGGHSRRSAAISPYFPELSEKQQQEALVKAQWLAAKRKESAQAQRVRQRLLEEGDSALPPRVVPAWPTRTATPAMPDADASMKGSRAAWLASQRAEWAFARERRLQLERATARPGELRSDALQRPAWTVMAFDETDA
eukprot:6174514-Pleurochrysis_carterae.AAC.2